jgi:outer membrane protein assembly factor BamD
MRNAALLVLILSGVLSGACGGRKATPGAALQAPAAPRESEDKPPEVREGAVKVYEPDRELYERAQKEMKRGRFDIARLTFQNLINTYLDSEFLPKAKYGLGEASYKEGGREKLEQAAAEFEDYITLFPTTDLADDAQLMIALTHYRQMLAPDRDATEARFALFELDKMIRDYPDSPLLEEAKYRRRVVQEHLATAAFEIGNLYLVRKQFGAAISRYEEVIKTYPDYSATDEVLYAMGEAMRRGKAVNARRTTAGGRCCPTPRAPGPSSRKNRPAMRRSS